MIERKKIIVNGKEVKKRYMGSTLLWENIDGLYKIVEEDGVTIEEVWDDIFTLDFSKFDYKSIDTSKISHIKLNDQPLIGRDKFKPADYTDTFKKITIVPEKSRSVDLSNYLNVPTNITPRKKRGRVTLYSLDSSVVIKKSTVINYESYKKYDKFTIVGYYHSDSKLMFYRSGASAKTPELNNAKFKGVKFKDDVVMPLSDYRVENTPSGSFITFYNVSNEMKEYFFKNKGGASRGDGFGSFKTVIYYE